MKIDVPHHVPQDIPLEINGLQCLRYVAGHYLYSLRAENEAIRVCIGLYIIVTKNLPQSPAKGGDSSRTVSLPRSYECGTLAEIATKRPAHVPHRSRITHGCLGDSAMRIFRALSAAPNGVRRGSRVRVAYGDYEVGDPGGGGGGGVMCSLAQPTTLGSAVRGLPTTVVSSLLLGRLRPGANISKGLDVILGSGERRSRRIGGAR